MRSVEGLVFTKTRENNLLLIKPERSRVVRLKQSYQQKTASQDRSRRSALDALNEKRQQLKEKKKAEKIDLSLVKYHAQELHDLLIQKPNHPLCAWICVRLKALLSLKGMKNIEAHPPKDNT